MLEKVTDDGDDIFEKVSDDAKDILEKVSDDGDDISETRLSCFNVKTNCFISKK